MTPGKQTSTKQSSSTFHGFTSPSLEPRGETMNGFSSSEVLAPVRLAREKSVTPTATVVSQIQRSPIATATSGYRFPFTVRNVTPRSALTDKASLSGEMAVRTQYRPSVNKKTVSAFPGFPFTALTAPPARPMFFLTARKPYPCGQPFQPSPIAFNAFKTLQRLSTPARTVKTYQRSQAVKANHQSTITNRKVSPCQDSSSTDRTPSPSLSTSTNTATTTTIHTDEFSSAINTKASCPLSALGSTGINSPPLQLSEVVTSEPSQQAFSVAAGSTVSAATAASGDQPSASIPTGRTQSFLGTPGMLTDQQSPAPISDGLPVTSTPTSTIGQVSSQSSATSTEETTSTASLPDTPPPVSIELSAHTATQIQQETEVIAKKQENGAGEVKKEEDAKPVKTAVSTNSKCIKYVIVPAAGSYVNRDKLKKIGVGASDGQKTVFLNGANFSVVPVSERPDAPNVPNHTADASCEIPNPEGKDSTTESSRVAGAGSAGTEPLLPSPKPLGSTIKTEATVRVKSEPDNVLPGTNLVYRTPGANNVNKKGKIKRPMNAFMVWARTYRAKLAEEFPNTTNSDVSVRLGLVWNEMNEFQKQPYYMEAERIKQRHKMQYPEWSYTPTPSRRRMEEPFGTRQTAAPGGCWSPHGAVLGQVTNGGNTFGETTLIKDPALGIFTLAPRFPAAGTYTRPLTPPPVTSALGQVYKPVPLRPAVFVKQEAPVPQDGSPAVRGTEQGNSGAAETQSERRGEEASAADTVDRETGCTLPVANGVTNDQKKRQRKPRIRRKGRKSNDLPKEGGPSTGQGHSLSGDLLATGSCAGKGTRGLDDDYPLDPYNPFYLLNLGEPEVDDRAADDIDIDGWTSYLGESGSLTTVSHTDPDRNLDVFLSQARVSVSATSHGSSDLDIVPTPLSDTLGRLRDTRHSVGTIGLDDDTPGPGAGSNLEARLSTNQAAHRTLNCDPHNRLGLATHHHQNHETRPETREPVSYAAVSDTNEVETPVQLANLSPEGHNLFVINEEVVETTPQTAEESSYSGEDGFNIGAGDSFKSKSTKPKELSPETDQTDHNSFTGENQSVTPPGKRHCV